MTRGTTVTTYEYDANNRLLKETTAGGVTSYQYDANGNTLRAVRGGDGVGAYTYSLFGNQMSYTPTGVVFTSYTSYGNYMVRTKVANYDAILGGYHSNGISSAVANPSYYALNYEPTVRDYQAVDTKENADSENQSEAKYYSADVYGGKEWKKTSGPMTFEEAKTWAENTKKGLEPIPNTKDKYYGKGASWGVYTEYEADARALGNALGQIDPRMDTVPSGFYQHYHLIGANGLRSFGKFTHFHVWFGPPMR